MKKVFTIHGTLRRWKDEHGKQHAQRIECGAIFQSSAGALVVKIEALPCTKDFTGWLSTVPVAPALPPGRRVPKGFPMGPLAPPPEPEPSPDDEYPL
jgi:hypothetical protein